MRILDLKRLGEKSVECRLEADGKDYLIDVDFRVDGNIKGLVLNGISQDDKWRLYSSPESLDLTRRLWSYFNGNAVELPLVLQPRENAEQGDDETCLLAAMNDG